MARESRRASELRESLADAFGLSPETAGRAMAAFIAEIRERLPRGAGIALSSWVPESWALLSGAVARTEPPARGLAALKKTVVRAGVPDDVAELFLRELVKSLGQRCGTPIADALRRRLPEIAAEGTRTARAADVLFPKL